MKIQKQLTFLVLLASGMCWAAPTKKVAPNSPAAREEFNYGQDNAVTSAASEVYSTLRNSRRSKQDIPGFDGDRVFSIGFRGAGAYGVFGSELEIGLDEDVGLGLGIGTGMSYSTWAAHLRYYFKANGRVNTFFQGGYANWYLGKVPLEGMSQIRPQFLGRRFFTNDQGDLEVRRVHLAYPGVGVLFQHESGLAAELMLQYLINLNGFNGALFGGFGWSYYF